MISVLLDDPFPTHGISDRRMEAQCCAAERPLKLFHSWEDEMVFLKACPQYPRRITEVPGAGQKSRLLGWFIAGTMFGA